MTERTTHRLSIGWREWVRLPELGDFKIKAKIDTGARSSSIHAFGIKYLGEPGSMRVRFAIHPLQRDSQVTVWTEAEVLEFREIRSSNGQISKRPVIVTPVQMGDESWPIEITLANRDAMGFRMLLGREALRERCLIDPGRSFYLGQPTSSKSQRAKRKKRSSSE